LDARHEILLENYIQRIQIEARALSEIAINQIIPAAVGYQSKLAENFKTMKDIGMEKEAATQKELLKKISAHINSIKEETDKMTEESAKITKAAVREKAGAYCNNIKPRFDKIREHIDQLEMLVEDSHWTLPKYRELLFIR